MDGKGERALLEVPEAAAIQPWAYEKDALSKGYRRIAGLDEAGRGPLAGPVVAAAVLLRPDFDISGIHDSKALTPLARERAYERIVAEALGFGVGVVGPEIIDEMNILRATYAAMNAALRDMCELPDFVLVDGLPVPGLPADSLAIVGGDGKCVSIAAASIVAKVTRDRIMLDLHEQFPAYGFASHKGYGTPAHLAALDRCGPCPIHRRSFSPVAERIANCRLPGLE